MVRAARAGRTVKEIIDEDRASPARPKFDTANVNSEYGYRYQNMKLDRASPRTPGESIFISVTGSWFPDTVFGRMVQGKLTRSTWPEFWKIFFRKIWPLGSWKSSTSRVGSTQNKNRSIKRCYSELWWIYSRFKIPVRWILFCSFYSSSTINISK